MTRPQHPDRTSPPPRRRSSVTAFVASAATVGAVLAGCGADTEGFNEADVAYATDVTTHHAQTLQVLDLSLGRRSVDPDLGRYADDTREALFAEVDTTQKLLKSWGQPVPRTALEHTHAQDYDYDTSIPGVLSARDMHALEKTRDAAFQKAWVMRLIELEEGAIELARSAVDDAQNADAADAARKDLEAHRARLAELREHT